MSIYSSRVWRDDLDEALSTFGEIEKISNSSILITGATGLICSAIVDLIMRFNEINPQKSIMIFAACRDQARFEKRFSKYLNCSSLRFVNYEATTKNEFNFGCDYIIHGASVTSPESYVTEAVETMVDNFWGIKTLLDYAKEYQIKRVLYISSSEVYGKKDDPKPFLEGDYGYVDILNPRSSYATGKRASETLCISYTNEYNIDTVIARPGHIYGPTASKHDKRVASLWAHNAANGVDIVMKSEGAQIRSYCHCLDCATAILKILMDGESKRAYNISNPEAIISIKQMAEILANCGGVNVIMDLPSDKEKAAFNPMINSSLNSDLLQQMGWRGIFDANKGLSHTVNVLKEIG